METVLLIEDNLGDVRLIREMFNEQGAGATVLIAVASVSKAEQHLAAHAVDLVILDLGLPDMQGTEALRRVCAAAPRVPVVVTTVVGDEATAARAVKDGAQDYLLRGEFEKRGLMRALHAAVERKALTLALSHSAQHDSLTGLPNRTLFIDRVGQAIASASRNASRIAVLFLDLDGFKHINDSLGHSTGDRLLQSVAQRLVACVRGADTVSRQGGDEFLVLLSEMQHLEDAAVAARLMLQSVAQANAIDDRDLHVTTSIGISVYPDDGVNAETLIQNADTAMYQAKDKGRRGYQFFKPSMNVRAVERQAIEEDLRRALERQEFVLVYQPKVDLRTGAITGAEALLRWTHPTRGPVAPAQFIPVAEDSGLILPIGAWVLREACEQARVWVKAGLPATTMAVNVSPMQFFDEGFLPGLFKTLSETELDPRCLELELTERVLMKHADVAIAILKPLRERGVRVALDDFGTGYCGLSYLRRFPLDTLKIDQSFIRQIGTASDDTAMVTAIISMARALKLRVVAEGVETAEQLAFLRSGECDESQGYYFSRPVAPSPFAILLEKGIPEAMPVQPRAAHFEAEEAEVAGLSLLTSIAPSLPLNERPDFLSTGLASQTEIRLAQVAVLISSLAFAAAVPFAKMPLAQIPGFTPIYVSALVICDLITAVLLFGQFSFLRSRSLLVLASGYLFTASITSSYVLMFPGLFATTGLLGAGPQSTSAMYMIWHAGFPLAVISYTLLKDDTAEAILKAAWPPRVGAHFAVLSSIMVVFALVSGFTFFATAGSEYLPSFIDGHHTTDLGRLFLSGDWMLSFLAFVVLFRQRPRTVIDLWLTVVMCVWLFDIALSAILNTGRYDLGWYVGRLYGLLGASFLLGVLLIENNKYFGILARMSAKLRTSNASFERLSLIDGLTSLANRRYFDRYLDNQIAVARRYNRQLSLILCDVDAFKAYNDHYGHQAGDECLKQVAVALQSCCRRPADMVARYGGEEFAMILPDTEMTGATLIAEAARHAVAQLMIQHAFSPTAAHISISGGVAVAAVGKDGTPQQLITAADETLYQAKQSGRNRMVSVAAEPAQLEVAMSG